MKFLYSLLSTLWIMYSWVCYDALQWKPPYIMPPHVQKILQNKTYESIEAGIQKVKLELDSPGLLDWEKADALRELATGYWLKSFFQDSRKTQFVYLKLSAKELKKILEIVPNWYQVNAWLADVYHIMCDYETADRYYTKALKYMPESQFYYFVRMRHQEMKRAWRKQTEDQEE